MRSAMRLAHGRRLLVDLLEHEGLVAALLGLLLVPVDRDRLVLDRARAVKRARVGDAVGRDGDDVAVVGELNVACVSDRKATVLEAMKPSSIADADDERTLAARPDEQFGVVAVDDDEGEVSLDLAIGTAHRLDQVALVVALDQVGDGLGVGLGREVVAFRDQRGAQLAVVLDDAVQDDGDLALVAAGERMGVLDHDLAVGRPARVPEPVRRLGAVRCRRPRSGAGGCRRRGCSRARRPRAGRSRPSRSRGTRAAAGRRRRSGLQVLLPTYPMIPHTWSSFPACARFLIPRVESRTYRLTVLRLPRKSTKPGALAAPVRTTGRALVELAPRSYHRDLRPLLAVSASASRRTTGSVPEARTSTRASPVELRR